MQNYLITTHLKKSNQTIFIEIKLSIENSDKNIFHENISISLFASELHRHFKIQFIIYYLKFKKNKILILLYKQQL